MKIKEAAFLTSSIEVTMCPKPDKPEYAFIGRSNVGKSSLINMITGKAGLAKTSGTPGKTQLINHFLIDNKWYLVDLPGYGFAKVSRTDREKFEKMINNFLFERTNLINTFVLIDVRHAAQKLDLKFMETLGINGIPFSIIFTKADKISKTAVNESVKAYEAAMLQTWENMPKYFISSSEIKTGKEEITSFIESLHDLYDPNLLLS